MSGIYGLGVWFPVLFACVAGMMAVSSFLNSQLVGRFGMRRLSHGALIGFLLVNTIWLLLGIERPDTAGLVRRSVRVAMVQFGWIGSNFNSIAMEPLGHVAGTASSTLGFMQTLGGGAIGATIGQLFDGTVLPLAIGFWSVSALGADVRADRREGQAVPAAREADSLSDRGIGSRAVGQ